MSEETPSFLAPRRKQLFLGRRAIVASTISTVLIIGGLITAFYLAPGGANVRHFFFDPHEMWQSFVGDPNHSLSSVGLGLLVNIKVFLIAEVFILIFALVLAWTRMSKSPVLLPFRILATVYSDVFRGIPVLAGLPAHRLRGTGTEIRLHLEPVRRGLRLRRARSSPTARTSRRYCAPGYIRVPHGQLLAARSLGLTNSTTMRRVILPQAVRTVVPPLLNDFISLQKDTALLSVLGVIEAVQAGTIYQDFNFNSSGLVVASLLFLAMTIPLTRFTDGLIARDRSRRLAST